MNNHEIIEKALNELNNKVIGAVTIPVTNYDKYLFYELEREAFLNGIKAEIDSFLNPNDENDFTNITFTRLEDGEVVDESKDGNTTYRIIYNPRGWILNRENNEVSSLQYGHNVNFAFVADYDLAERIVSLMISESAYPCHKKEVLEVEV